MVLDTSGLLPDISSMKDYECDTCNNCSSTDGGENFKNFPFCFRVLKAVLVLILHEQGFIRKQSRISPGILDPNDGDESLRALDFKLVTSKLSFVTKMVRNSNLVAVALSRAS